MKQFITAAFAILIIFGSSCGIFRTDSQKFTKVLNGNWELIEVQKTPKFTNNISAKEINDIIDAKYSLTYSIDESGEYIKMKNQVKETGKTTISEDTKTLSFGADKYTVLSYSKEEMQIQKGDYSYTFQKIK